MEIATNSPIKVLGVLEITNTILDEKGNKVTEGSVVYKLMEQQLKL